MPHSSVTEVSCTCSSLERMAAEPSCPVEFDEETNEFQIVVRGADGVHSAWAIYHCLLCGGAAPKSLRSTLFAELASSERSRLLALTESVNTIEKVLAEFGAPTSDMPHGFVSHSKPTEDDSSVSTAYRVLRYSNLSETAEVDFIDLGPEGVRKSFRGKYLGKPAT